MEVIIMLGLAVLALWLLEKNEEQINDNIKAQADIENEIHQTIVRGQVNEAN